MPLVKAQCTNCNGFLEVDSSKDAAICPHCGTPYVVEKAIQQFNITNNNTNYIQNATIISNEKNKNPESTEWDQHNRLVLEEAKKLLDAGRYDEANEKYLHYKGSSFGSDDRFLMIKAWTHDFSEAYLKELINKILVEEKTATDYSPKKFNLNKITPDSNNWEFRIVSKENNKIRFCNSFIYSINKQKEHFPEIPKYADYTNQIDAYCKTIQNIIDEDEKNAAKKREEEEKQHFIEYENKLIKLKKEKTGLIRTLIVVIILGITCLVYIATRKSMASVLVFPGIALLLYILYLIFGEIDHISRDIKLYSDLTRTKK